MSLPYKCCIKFNDQWRWPSFGLSLPDDSRNLINVPSLIDSAGGGAAAKQQLLNFVNSVIAGTNEESGTGANEYTLCIVEKNGQKLFKIFTHLRDDFPESFPPPCYITPEEFKEILEIWMREERRFYEDPEKYKEEMLRNGATLLGPHNVKDIDDYKRKIDEAKNGVVSDWREAKSDKLDMLPREFSDKGKADESNRPWWQFWK